MVTVIDMTTGEVLHSSQPQKCEGNASYEQKAYALPALALQEIALEPERDSHKVGRYLKETGYALKKLGIKWIDLTKEQA